MRSQTFCKSCSPKHSISPSVYAVFFLKKMLRFLISQGCGRITCNTVFKYIFIYKVKVGKTG